MKSLVAMFSGLCLFLAAAPLCLCSGVHEKGTQTSASCCSHRSTVPVDEKPCPHCDQAGSLVLDKAPVSDFLNGTIGSELPPPTVSIVRFPDSSGTVGNDFLPKTEARPPNCVTRALICVYRV